MNPKPSLEYLMTLEDAILGPAKKKVQESETKKARRKSHTGDRDESHSLLEDDDAYESSDNEEKDGTSSSVDEEHANAKPSAKPSLKSMTITPYGLKPSAPGRKPSKSVTEQKGKGPAAAVMSDVPTIVIPNRSTTFTPPSTPTSEPPISPSRGPPPTISVGTGQPFNVAGPSVAVAPPPTTITPGPAQDQDPNERVQQDPHHLGAAVMVPVPPAATTTPISPMGQPHGGMAPGFGMGGMSPWETPNISHRMGISVPVIPQSGMAMNLGRVGNVPQMPSGMGNGPQGHAINPQQPMITPPTSPSGPPAAMGVIRGMGPVSATPNPSQGRSNLTSSSPTSAVPPSDPEARIMTRARSGVNKQKKADDEPQGSRKRRSSQSKDATHPSTQNIIEQQNATDFVTENFPPSNQEPSWTKGHTSEFHVTDSTQPNGPNFR